MSAPSVEHLTQAKIIDAAKILFIEQGFNQTSVRQIVHAASVTTGSLYHFFSGKEAILQAIVQEYLQVVFEKAQSKIEADQGKHMPFFYEITFTLRLIERYENLRNLLVAVYNSFEVSNLIFTTRAKLLKIWFGEYTSEFNHNDYYNRAVLIKGMIQSILNYKLANPSESLDEHVNLLALTTAQMFNLPESEIQRVVKAISRLEERDVPVLTDFEK